MVGTSMSGSDQNKAGAIRHLPMKADTWLMGITRDELEDVRTECLAAATQMSRASAVASAGFTVIVSAFFASLATPVPVWAWAIGALAFGLGAAWFGAARHHRNRVGQILARVEARYKSEAEMNNLPLAITEQSPGTLPGEE